LLEGTALVTARPDAEGSRAERVSEKHGDRRYRAPTLEMGLDILERLAAGGGPVTQTGRFNRLSRSQNELLRVVKTLELRGYIERDAASSGYQLSDRSFLLAKWRPPARTLIEIALPVMRRLALSLEQSCHLALHSQGEVAIVARMESSEQFGLSKHVGYRRSLLDDPCGALLYAFQPPEVRRRWEKLFDPSVGEEELGRFRARADAICGRTFDLTPNLLVADVIDISAPIMRGGAAAAALTVPFLRKQRQSLTPQEAAVRVRDAAERISVQLVVGHEGV
jgi:DNA-binding IclR family transcriptional regulator